MKSDPILEEVWRAKDELAKRFDYDIHRLAEYLRGKDAELKTQSRKAIQTRPGIPATRSGKISAKTKATCGSFRSHKSKSPKS
jgi:hypothetical protein